MTPAAPAFDPTGHADLPTVFPTVVEMLADAAARAPGVEALVCGGRSLDYAGYLRCVAGLATELRDMGAAGRRVALIAGNSIHTPIAQFAIHAAGAQMVALNPLYSRRELRIVLADCTPAVLIHDGADAAAALAAEMGIETVIGIGAGGRDLTAWADDTTAALPSPAPGPDDIAGLQYTGGTTGLPKGVEIRHRAMALNIAQREALLPTRAEAERVLCVMPLFHVYAQAMALHLACYARSTLVILERYHPETVMDAIAAQRVTLFPGSPTIYTGLMKHEAFAEADFSTLRLCYSGAERLPEQTLRAWEEATGCTVLEGYGLSESGPVLSFNPERGVHKPHSVGVPVPLTEIRIVDARDGANVLPAGEAGEICARGPQVMGGYHGRPDETAAALREGWLHTGDLGRLDDDGYLFIVGRKKEMMIVGGYNVYPREIEEVLYQHTEVLEAAVLGRPDDYKGEAVTAFVVPRTPGWDDAEAITAFCAHRLARYKVPTRVEFLDAMPRTTVGKIDKNALATQGGTSDGPV